MSKIMILSNNAGGLYKFRKELLLALIEKNHEVVVVVPDGTFMQEISEFGCTVEQVSMERHGMNPLKELNLLRFYRKILKRYRPDIVFTYTIKPNVYGGMCCASQGIPYVANITGLGTAVENPGMMQKISLLLYRSGLRKAKKVFFQNQENQKFLVSRKVISGDYDLLPGSGVNLNQYAVLDYPSAEVVNFFFVARLVKEKGIEQYLDAAECIHEKYPNTVFHVCGAREPEYDMTRINRLCEEGVVIYHGSVKDMVPMYEIDSCTVHPTYYPEGLSNVLLESCASGRPIITTNRSGCREVVDEGINGYVVREKDSSDLIEKIEKFLQLSWCERREMGLAGRSKIEKEFDRQIVVDKYMEELK